MGDVNRGWKIAGGIWAGLSVFIAIAATVPAKQAMSNPSSWADELGLTATNNFLAHNPWAILAGRILVYLNLLLILIFYTIKFVEWRQRKRQERLEDEEDYRRATGRN